jgi:hypothetical protein
MVTLYEILHSPSHPLHENVKREMKNLESNHPHVARQLDRIKLIYWLHEHAASLPKLARDKKFKIEQQIENHFDAEDAHALKTLLYPVKQRSIAAQFFYIPLSYIPAILRLVLTVCMSVLAFISGFPHPWRPIQRAGESLVRKIAFDLNRLLIFTTELIRLTGKCIASVFKAVAFTINLIAGRIGGLFRSHLGHYFHQGFATLHRGLTWLREYFYPASATASVVTGHPLSTLEKFTESYHKLLHKLQTQNGIKPSATSQLVAPHFQLTDSNSLSAANASAQEVALRTVL